MKKVIAIIVVLAMIAAVAMAPAMGYLAERQMSQNIGRAEAMGFWRVERHDFERGWGSSSASLEIGFDENFREAFEQALRDQADADVANETIAELGEMFAGTLTLIIDMNHGPFLNGAGAGLYSSRIYLDPETPGVGELQQRLDIPYLIEFRTKTGFDGATHVDGDIPAFDVEEDGAAFASSGMRFDADYDWGGGTVVSTAEIESIAFANETGGVLIDGISIEGEQHAHSDLLWLGDASGGIETVVITGPAGGDQVLLEMSKLGFEGGLEQPDGKESLSVGAAYLIELVTFLGHELSDAELRLRLDNVPITAAEGYLRLSQELAFLSEERTQEFMPQLQGIAYDILAASPVLELEALRFNWDEQPFAATASLRLDGSLLPAEADWVPLDIILLQQMLSMDVEAEIDEQLALAIVETQLRNSLMAEQVDPSAEITPEQIDAFVNSQAPIMLAQFEAQGLLRRTETGFTVKASMEGGQLVVNGNPLLTGPIQ